MLLPAAIGAGVGGLVVFPLGFLLFFLKRKRKKEDRVCPEMDPTVTDSVTDVDE
jgi:hypothetical protein